MPSFCNKAIFVLVPSLYEKSPTSPLLLITLWQGTIIGFGFFAIALPTARYALDFKALATSFYVEILTAGICDIR